MPIDPAPQSDLPPAALARIEAVDPSSISPRADGDPPAAPGDVVEGEEHAARLAEVQAERDALAAQLAETRWADVERIATEVGLKQPAVLRTLGILDLSAVLTDAGAIDPEAARGPSGKPSTRIAAGSGS